MRAEPLPHAMLTAERGAPAARERTIARLLGVGLLLAVILPLYRLLGARETGLAGEVTVALTDAYRELSYAGLLLFALAALTGALLLSDARALRIGRVLERMLTGPRAIAFAGVMALIAGLLTLLFTHFVLAGLPNHIDSLAQLQHARLWATGRLSGQGHELGAFALMQNSLFTPHGWVSQYPPGHVAVLALGLVLGAPAMAGAVLVSGLVFSTALLSERLLPEHRTGARLGIVLLATSPFVITLGGSYMSHITAAALIAGAAYALVRVRDGGSQNWLALAGVLLAWCFATRPLVALAAGSALLLSLFSVRALLHHRFMLVLLGGAAPILAALFAYNTHFFGAPLRFGYDLTLGPNAGLGWQRDPWGNVYGAVEAVAYTSADVVSLNTALLESPLPALLFVAVFLLIARRVEPGVRVLLAWALAPVAANLLYWHHGQFMGPRMLYETAPAWLLLTGIATVALARVLPAHIPRAKSFALRSAYGTAVVGSLLLGWFLLAPSRALSYGANENAVTRTPLPNAPAHALVFVHDAWRGRVAMRLAASGMRLDSVEVAMRANPTCTAQRLADAIDRGDAAQRDGLMRSMDFRARGRDLPALSELTPGNRIVLEADAPLTGECLRQAYSDRHGVLDLAPLAWRGAVMGSDDDTPLFVRDLGPEMNQKMRAAAPQRTAYVYVPTGPQQTPTLLPYDQGMALLWGATP